MRLRIAVAALSFSAAAFVGLLNLEGYEEVAAIPVKGDVPTLGFGTTQGVKLGERTTPVKAVNRALSDVQKYEGAVKRCVTVPLYQHEYDAYLSLAYNIGLTAFCKSTLVKYLNAEKYPEACREILKWNKFKGKPLRGLTIRRQAEYRQCMGQS
jgi:lysozyme